MNPLKVDRYILDTLEAYAWKFQEENDRDNFWLAKGCILLCAVVTVIMSLPFGWPSVLFAVEVEVPFVLIIWVCIDNAEIYTVASRGCRNPYRDLWPFRVFAILIYILPYEGLDWFALLGVISDGLFSLAVYFMSCNAKPPGWKVPQKVPKAKFSFAGR